MSGVQKPPGGDMKSPDDHDRSEQPIDLAQRTSHNSALRTHVEPAKSAFTTVRVPAGPRPSFPAPVTALSGATTVTAKAGGSTTQASALRHLTTTTIHPVMASSSTMASIIRGHSISQTVTAHMVHSSGPAPYSSHVPRGPAAVASISTAPKSSLATPIRGSTTSGAPGSANASSHLPVGARSASIASSRPQFMPRTSSSLAMTQVIDLQKSSAHGGAQVQIGLSSSRPIDASGRQSISHAAPSSNLGKSLHVTQPIVQHLQQVNDKTFFKSASGTAQFQTVHSSSGSHQVTVSSTPSTTASSSASSTHLTPHTNAPSTPRALTTMSVVTIAPAPLVAQTTPFSQTSAVTQSVALQPTVTTASNLHSIFTVVSNKGNLPAVTTQSRIGSTLHSSSGITTVQTATTPSTVVSTSSRPVTTTVTIQPPSIPVAKVYPQPLSVPAHSTLEPVEGSSIYVAQTARNLPVSTTTSAHIPAATAVVLSDNRTDRQPLSGASSYAVPAAATYYYEPYHVPSTITMHHYTGSGGPNTPSPFPTAISPSPSNLRPAARSHTGPSSPHASITSTGSHTTATTVASVRPVMVTVDPNRQHISMHNSFSPSTGSTISTSDVVVTQAAPLYCTASSNINLLSPTHTTVAGQGSTNHNSSPRPSILRKRNVEGINVNVKKNLIASLPSSGPTSPHPDASLSSTSSPKSLSDTQQESSSQSSSNSTADVSEPARQPPAVPIIKQEPPDNNNNSSDSVIANGSPAVKSSAAPVEASPRKKPRKQLLAANELIETHSTDNEEEVEKDTKENIKKEIVNDDEHSRWVTFCKRPSMSLLTSYSHNWKSRHNHFMRHSDVKPKDDKKLTVNELANQKGVLQKANGWKVYHLTSQMEEVVFLEDTVYSKLSQLLEFIERKPPAIQTKPMNNDEERILSKINDLIKGNLQRSKIVQDQVTEAKQQVLKVLEHKSHIVEIIGKYVSKRPLKKREKM